MLSLLVISMAGLMDPISLVMDLLLDPLAGGWAQMESAGTTTGMNWEMTMVLDSNYADALANGTLHAGHD